MESLGITQIPIVSKRRKQQIRDLQIDTDGIISIEDEIDDDADFTTAGEDHLLIDSDEDLSDHETTLVESVAARESRNESLKVRKRPHNGKR